MPHIPTLIALWQLPVLVEGSVMQNHVSHSVLKRRCSNTQKVIVDPPGHRTFIFM